MSTTSLIRSWPGGADRQPALDDRRCPPSPWPVPPARPRPAVGRSDPLRSGAIGRAYPPAWQEAGRIPEGGGHRFRGRGGGTPRARRGTTTSTTTPAGWPTSRAWPTSAGRPGDTPPGPDTGAQLQQPNEELAVPLPQAAALGLRNRIGISVSAKQAEWSVTDQLSHGALQPLVAAHHWARAGSYDATPSLAR